MGPSRLKLEGELPFSCMSYIQALVDQLSREVLSNHQILEHLQRHTGTHVDGEPIPTRVAISS